MDFETPRGIHQKTIIQHTLRFSDTGDCFQKFRLVCKSWKDAVETIRFNRMIGDEKMDETEAEIGFFDDLDEQIKSQAMVPNINYFCKYLALFKKNFYTFVFRKQKPNLPFSFE